METHTLLWIVCAVVLDGFAAVFGAVLRESLILRWRDYFIAAAAGVMLGVAFLEVVPEAMEKGLSSVGMGIMLLAGFCLFYAVEQFFAHEEPTSPGGAPVGPSTVGPSILFGDALHNITDGVAVATAFLSSTNVGIALALAVFFHELPHETGDYAVLVAHGYSRKRAVLWMFLIQMSALIGAVGIFFMAGFISDAVPWLLAFSAGGFVYIAAVKLLPTIMRAGNRKLGKGAVFFGGVLLAGAIRIAFGV